MQWTCNEERRISTTGIIMMWHKNGNIYLHSLFFVKPWFINIKIRDSGLMSCFVLLHSGLDFIKIGKKIRTFFLGHLYWFPIQGISKIQWGIRIWREKNEKHRSKGLNRPFIEVAHFENTITNDSEILPGFKKKIPNTPKWFILIWNCLI